MISHNREFTGALCPEVWQIDDGCVTVLKGDVPDKGAGKGSRQGEEKNGVHDDVPAGAVTNGVAGSMH